MFCLHPRSRLTATTGNDSSSGTAYDGVKKLETSQLQTVDEKIVPANVVHSAGLEFRTTRSKKKKMGCYVCSLKIKIGYRGGSNPGNCKCALIPNHCTKGAKQI
ncbi:hypothetical protein YC2023_084354 [Brassica napus]